MIVLVFVALWIALTVISLKIYHKIFDIVYFSGMAMVKEVVTAGFLCFWATYLVLKFLSGLPIIPIVIVVGIIAVIMVVRKRAPGGNKNDADDGGSE
ncbi:hypothetical protein LJC64_03025 [Ruminococcaceae bacterium OttesenSCG-928-A11]|nr:hypothetical protein [Ruminococcaceae bacterium OttesenSCG-928-A11]